MSKHTATPWHVGESNERKQQVEICGGADPFLGFTGWEGLAICNGCLDDPIPGMEAARANAAHIVRCVNSHDALVDALRVIAFKSGNEEIIAIAQRALAAAKEGT